MCSVPARWGARHVRQDSDPVRTDEVGRDGDDGVYVVVVYAGNGYCIVYVKGASDC